MEKLEIVVPTLFGVESVASDEIKKLGCEIKSVTDGRIVFYGSFEDVCRANIWLRTGDRVLIKIGEFSALTFDELFEGCKALPWADWLPKNCAFPVKGFSIKSALFSVPDCQALIKKSIAEAMSKRYNIKWFKEDGPLYQISFGIIKDVVTLMIDTTGAGLHKRGYRQNANDAPLRETLASAIISISRWQEGRPLADPMCGSGTFPIEAAMMAQNMAPGLERGFYGEALEQLPPTLWKTVREEAKEAMKPCGELEIFASDIDNKSVELTRENCRKAKVQNIVRVKQMPLKDFSAESAGGTLVCNPPYGKRLGEIKEAEKLYKELGKMYGGLERWKLYALTSHEMFERYFGKKADRKRKLYNGMMKCDLYMYFKPAHKT